MIAELSNENTLKATRTAVKALQDFMSDAMSICEAVELLPRPQLPLVLNHFALRVAISTDSISNSRILRFVKS